MFHKHASNNVTNFRLLCIVEKSNILFVMTARPLFRMKASTGRAFTGFGVGTYENLSTIPALLLYVYHPFLGP